MTLCYIKFETISRLSVCVFSIFLINSKAQAATLSFYADRAADSQLTVAETENYISNLLEASEIFSEDLELNNLDLAATAPDLTPSAELENFLAVFDPLSELRWQANNSANSSVGEFTILPQTRSSQIFEDIYDYRIQLRSPRKNPSFRPRGLQTGREIFVPNASTFTPENPIDKVFGASSPGSNLSFLLQLSGGNRDYFIAELSNSVLSPREDLPRSPEIDFRQEISVNYAELSNFRVTLASYGDIAPSVELRLLPGRELARQILKKYEENYETKLVEQDREERLRREQEQRQQKRLEKATRQLF